MEYSIGYYNIIIQVYSNLPCCPLELGSVECGMSAIAHTASHSTKNMYQTAAVVDNSRACSTCVDNSHVLAIFVAVSTSGWKRKNIDYFGQYLQSLSVPGKFCQVVATFVMFCVTFPTSK